MSDTRSNIVLVTVDSLRADHCGFMGYDGETTPTLDRMAAEGVVFETAIAPGSATPQSMPQIFTGTDIGDDQSAGEKLGNSEISTHLATHRTIPERLSERGYETLGFTPNPFTSREFGFDTGFDYYEDFLGDASGLDLRKRIVTRWIEDKFIAGIRFGINMVGLGDISMTWEQYYDRIIEQVAAAEQPFFLWVFLLEPHWPYQPPTRHDGNCSVIDKFRLNWKQSNLADTEPASGDIDPLFDLYDGTIRHVDEFVARLHTDLSEYDPTVVVHADHGEAFGEHGRFGHGQNLFSENIHVPLLIADGPAAERVEEPLSLCRLPGIIDALAASEEPDWSQFTEPWVVARSKNGTAVRSSEWTYLREGANRRLYDLAADPAETEPIEPTESATAAFEGVLSWNRTKSRERDAVVNATRRLPNV